MCRKVLHVYYFSLHHIVDIMIFHLIVFSIYQEKLGSQGALHTALGYHHRIHLMVK